MSNVDIRLILPELKSAIEGGFVKNIYQYGDVFVLKVYQPGGGTANLLVEPGRRVHLTQFRRAAPRNPPKFATVLRKYVRDRRILRLYQHDLDRIIVIEIEGEESKYKIVAELFGTGNLLLLDGEDHIFVALRYKRMRDRDIVPRANYRFPPPRGRDIFEADLDHLGEILNDSKSSVVRTLASRLNLDALSCEEICTLGGVDPSANIADLDSTSVERLMEGMREFRERLSQGVREPRIVFEPGEEGPRNVAFTPFPFETFRNHPYRTFDTFSQAIDEYFGVTESELGEEEEEDALLREKKRLMIIIERQQEGIESLRQRAEAARRAGEIIYANFQLVDDVLESVRKARDSGLDWPDIIERVERGKREGNPAAAAIEKILPSQARITLNLEGTEIDLDVRLNVQDNAARYYEIAKKTERKIKGALEQIEKTKAKLAALAMREAPVETIPKRRPVRIRRKRWYEKFRWFISSEGFLVIGGRDAKTNEIIAKRYLEPNDLFLHAALHGAPYTVIKVPSEKPGETTIREAAQFAVSYSRAWQDCFSSGDAYWVTPEQVSFSAPSGEYLPAGSVMIYGSKNYIRGVPVELAVGVLLEEEWAVPMGGPPTAVAAHTPYHVVVQPGDTKKGQLVREIVAVLRSIVPAEQATLIVEIPEEDIMRVLPTGSGRIVREHG